MKYYRSYAESHRGDEGEFFCEVDNGMITRHISLYNNILYWATPSNQYDVAYFFTDQPEFELTDSETEMTQEEFLNLWDRALNQ